MPVSVQRRGGEFMLSTDHPVPFFEWKALFAERADRYSRIIEETASCGGFILQQAV